MPLAPEERANLMPGIDAARLERFLEQLPLPPELRAGMLAALSRTAPTPAFGMGVQARPVFLPPQPGDFTFDDPEVAAEWAAIANSAL